MLGTYERKQVYNIEEVLSKQVNPSGYRKRKENKVDFDGDLIYMDSHRYWLFKHKGIECTCCGIKGEYFAKERAGNVQSYHFNLYGKRNDGTEVMLTKDHIIPKSKGGKDDLNNYNTLCYDCNQEKGDIL
jgi:5-methylcytosine-specific restriction endonuclease McrA